jgi:hypothetical protein
MVARFTINAVPALAVLSRCKAGEDDDPTVTMLRRPKRQPSQPFVPKYKRIAPDVDQRRKAGEGFDRLAREMKVGRGTILRAYDFANRGEAAAATRGGRTPSRPPSTGSDESRTARRKPRNP